MGIFMSQGRLSMQEPQHLHHVHEENDEVQERQAGHNIGHVPDQTAIVAPV